MTQGHAAAGAVPTRITGRRFRALGLILACLFLLAGLFAWSWTMGDMGLKIDFTQRNLGPCTDHPLGTDWLGRDMMTRTVQGLVRSLGIGMAAALSSTVFALFIGIGAALLGRWADALATAMVDVVTAMPHLVLLILISFCLGSGAKGVVTALALTHWTYLARVIRAEVLQLKTADYIRISAKLGKGRTWIACCHVLPHLFPQVLVGGILIFPHAIMHAAGLTFLGFGLSPHTPSIGILLSEAMGQLSCGYWWLAAGPGAALVLLVKLFDLLGHTLRYLLDPKTRQA